MFKYLVATFFTWLNDEELVSTSLGVEVFLFVTPKTLSSLPFGLVPSSFELELSNDFRLIAPGK